MKTPFSLINRLLAYLISGIYFAEPLSPPIYLLLLVFCAYLLSCYYLGSLFQKLFLGLLWLLIGSFIMNQGPKTQPWPELAVVQIKEYDSKSAKRHKFKAKGLGGSILLYTKDSLESGGLYAAKIQLFDSIYNHRITRAFVNDYTLIEPPKNPSLRTAIINRWRALGVSPAPLGLLATVMVAERSMIAPRLKAQFRQLGASHVLAISGLHVGVLYILINGLIFFIPQPYRRILLVGCLLTYAHIAGFSPSVVRATLIFSLYALAHWVRRIPSKAQLLSVSAFLSLLIQPQLLYDLSFLMSYSAVTAIVISLRPLKAFEPKAKWLRYLYYLIGISIAAQLGVAPIALITFKTISAWFLIGSLALVPLMPFILGLGLLALTSSIGAQVCDKALKSVITLVDALAQIVPEPHRIEGFDRADAAIYYALFASLMYLAHKALDQRRGQQHHYS